MIRVDALVAQMNELAGYTWDRLVFSAEQGFSFREDSITEHNLFELARQHPELLVRRFNGMEEAGNGADWEWWIGGRTQGWVGLRVQAKKLTSDGIYHEISHRDTNLRWQYDVLIESSMEDGRRYGAPIWPFYCFYNGWSGFDGGGPAWPEGVPNLICPKGVVPPNCRHARLRDYGCAIALAVDAAMVHQGPLGSRTTLNGHLARSRPWSHLFVAEVMSGGSRLRGGRLVVDEPDSIARILSHRSYGWSQAVIRNASVGYVSDRYRALFSDLRNAPGSELPPYAQALLDGRSDSGVERPEAKFVAVLNAEAPEVAPQG